MASSDSATNPDSHKSAANLAAAKIILVECATLVRLNLSSRRLRASIFLARLPRGRTGNQAVMEGWKPVIAQDGTKMNSAL